MLSIDGRVGNLEGRVGNLEGNVLQLRRDVRRGYEGSAIAMALAGAVLPPGKNFAVSANVGTFRGETGFGGSAAVRINEFASANAGIGVGTSRGGVGGRAGVTLAW